MKYKKKLENLRAVQAWFDRLSERYKVSLTRPGSINQTTCCAS